MSEDRGSRGGVTVALLVFIDPPPRPPLSPLLILCFSTALSYRYYIAHLAPINSRFNLTFWFHYPIAVREDRTPGGRHRHRSLQDHRPKKQRARDDTTNGTTNGLDSVEGAAANQKPAEPEAPQEDFMSFIEKIGEQVTQIPHIPGQSYENETTKDKDVNKMMELAYQELYMIIQWAKDVPGFKEIDLEDQVCLLKASFMDLNVFRLAYRSVPCDPNSLRFGKELFCEKHEVTAFGWAEDLVDTTLEFTDKLRSLNMDVNEFACLNALVLLSPGLCPFFSLYVDFTVKVQ